MKTKNKKTSKKSASSVKRHLVFWPSLLVLSIGAVSYQIVRANGDSGLPLSTPSGSVAREAQLDSIELQQQAQADQSYDVQQSANAQSDGTGLSHMTEVLDDAAQ